MVAAHCRPGQSGLRPTGPTLRLQRIRGCRSCEAIIVSEKVTSNQNTIMPEKIGFVGVGRMGSNMARRLKECGYEIAAIYDVNSTAAQTLAQELGTQATEDLKQVTKQSDVIITVVTDDKAMKKI